MRKEIRLRGKPNIRQYKRVVERILLSLPGRFSGLKIDCYVLMSTHLHVIFALVRSWQRNYYEHVIRTEAALFKIREYIENNPLAERIRFEEFYKSGSDKPDPYKNSPPPP